MKTTFAYHELCTSHIDGLRTKSAVLMERSARAATPTAVAQLRNHARRLQSEAQACKDEMKRRSTLALANYSAR